MAELNGRPVSSSELQSLALTNYGHFTSMRVEDRHVRGLQHHLDRLVRDCQALFDAELSTAQVREFVGHAIEDKQGSFVVRITVFDPALDLGRPSIDAAPNVLVTSRPAAPWPLPPLRVKSAHYRRETPAIKHVGLYGALRHRRSAQLGGFDDALFTDGESVVLEGPTWNIGFFDGSKVVWPAADVLPGVTMTLLQGVHGETAIAPVNLAMIPAMQAAFATNTAVGVRTISAIDGIELPEEGPVLDILRKEYAEIPADSL
jgi:branched-subunit amino acid aminotransferase/4-amino-4-deoxychorismate lyase